MKTYILNEVNYEEKKKFIKYIYNVYSQLINNSYLLPNISLFGDDFVTGLRFLLDNVSLDNLLRELSNYKLIERNEIIIKILKNCDLYVQLLKNGSC
jgi:hypothetical protein